LLPEFLGHYLQSGFEDVHKKTDFRILMMKQALKNYATGIKERI